MILHNTQKIHCKDIRNELKSYHNKIEWVNFVLMQDSWPQSNSDSISWRKTLKNSQNLQIQWPVVSTLCQRKVGFGWTLRLDPYWKSQFVAHKANTEWKSELSLWTRTILTRGSEFLMACISWSRTWTTKSRTTTSRKPEKCSSKISVEIEYTCFCKPIKGQSKTTKTYFCQFNHKNYTYWGKNLDRYGTTRLFAHRLFSVEEIDQSSSSWKSTSRRRWSGRASWQEKEETRKGFSIVLILQEKFFTSELFKVIQGAILLILLYRTMLIPNNFFEYVHLSYRMCNQFTFHHQFSIDTGRSKFEQKTDSILSACESYGKGTQWSWDDRLGSTASCTVHA